MPCTAPEPAASGGPPPQPNGNRTMKTAPAPRGNPRLAALRAAKAALLPRAAELAAAGRSYQEIADTLGIAKSTVCQWLRGRPLGRAAAKALGTPRMTGFFRFPFPAPTAPTPALTQPPAAATLLIVEHLLLPSFSGLQTRYINRGSHENNQRRQSA